MPYIAVQITGRPDSSQSARIAQEISLLTEKHLRKDPTVTAVAVTHVDPEHWFAGGQSLAAQRVASFWLDVKVVDGANTKKEFSAYIEAVFAAMGRILGPLHHESYILVHEVPAAAYGFGGKTQEYRFIAGQLSAH